MNTINETISAHSGKRGLKNVESFVDIEVVDRGGKQW
jgi:hypothetical protein